VVGKLKRSQKNQETLDYSQETMCKASINSCKENDKNNNSILPVSGRPKHALVDQAELVIRQKNCTEGIWSTNKGTGRPDRVVCDCQCAESMTWLTNRWHGRPNNKNLENLVSAVHISGRLGLWLVDQRAWKMPINEIFMHFEQKNLMKNNFKHM
jgi:hypothetical protein